MAAGRTDHAGLYRAVAFTALIALIVAPPLSVVSTAQAPARTAPPAVAAGKVASTGTVVGTAWQGDVPLPHALIRLRDVRMGRNVGRTETNPEGRFRFDRVEPGSYVVELLSPQEKVLAVGDLFGVIAAEESTTLVRLSSKAPWFTGFFGNAAAAVISAASTLGVTAAGSNGRPVSPQ
jgi:hypothetical protein